MTQFDRDDIIQQITAKISWKVYLSIFISCIVTTASVVWTGATVYYGFEGRVNQNSASITRLQKQQERADEDLRTYGQELVQLRTCCEGFVPTPARSTNPKLVWKK